MQRIAFVTLEFALVTLEWAFAVVDELVSHQGAILITAALALVWAFATSGKVSIRINTRTHPTCTRERQCGKVSIRIFDLRKVGQGHGVQFSQ